MAKQDQEIEEESPLEGEETPEMEEAPEVSIQATEIEVDAAPASLESGVQDLADSWQPQTPEGQQYKQELQDLLAQFEGGEESMEDAGPLDAEEFGFSLGGMREAAAKRALQ